MGNVSFGIYFFADTVRADAEKYDLLLTAAKFADANGFSTVWVPERHFQPFGGLYPSPSVAGAALAVLTNRIRIHAGSVVAPLNDPLRVAEEWSMIDNLSHGRAGIAFAAGWHFNDFVLAPNNYEKRRQVTIDVANTVRRLWKGETVTLTNGLGQPAETRIYPAPIQPELPTWLTAQSDDTCANAGTLGFNLLTNYNHKTRDVLAKKIRLYREAIQRAHNRPGRVTLMAHTFIADDEAELNRIAVPALNQYLDVNLELQAELVKGIELTMTAEDKQFLRELAVRQFIKESGFIVTKAEMKKRVEELSAIGVDEIACLIDFGVSKDGVLKSLQRIADVMNA